MAQGFWQAKDEVLGTTPSGFFDEIQDGATATFTIVNLDGKKAGEYSNTDNFNLTKFLSYIDTTPNIDLRVCFRSQGVSSRRERFYAGYNTYVQIQAAEEFQLVYAGSANDENNAFASYTLPYVPSDVAIRFQIIDNGTDYSIKGKIWQPADVEAPHADEPSTWTLEANRSSLDADIGGWGFGARRYGGISTHTYWLYSESIGTNGDPAPTGPVDPGGDEAGDITSAASSTDSWAAQVQSVVSLTSAAAASDQATAIASVNLSIMEAAQATDVTGDAPAAVGSMTDAATGNDTVDALTSAAAAISAGAAAGESWTVQAQVLVNLVEQGAAADEIRRQTESAVTAALEAQSLASDQFIAALDTIASLSDSASVTDAYQAIVLQLASIASGAVASDSFRMLFGLQRAIQEAALADASFSISYAFVNALRSGGLSGDAWALMANLNASLSDVCSVADLMSVRASTTARLTAGAIASSSFAIVNAGVRYLIMGAVILRDALQYRVNTKPALNQSVKIKPGH